MMGGSGTLRFLLLLALIAALAILVAVGSIWLANRLVPKPRSNEYNAALRAFLTTISVVYGVFLGLTVVVAREQFSTATANVANEASTLTTMYRQTVGMPEPEQTQMRELLRKYTTAVMGEWQNQDTGGTSDTARAAITDMYHNIGSQQPNVASSPITKEFLSQLTTLAIDRNTRVLDAHPTVPWLFWFGLFFGGVLLITISGFIDLDNRRAHAMLSSAVAVLLGLLLFIVFRLDHPFGSPLGITSAPFEHALSIFDDVDRGT